MVAKQAAKSTAKKKTKTTAKKKPAAGKTSRASVRPPERGKNALYVLIIMGLVTALALLFGKFYMPQRPLAEKPPAEKQISEKKEDKREKQKEAAEKEKESKTAREEKTKKQTEIKESPEKKQAESVKVYFVALNEKTDKMYLSPVTRKVGGESLLENTLRELVKGPTAAEKRKGLLTAIPPELKINSVNIRNKTAEIDFNTAIEYGAAGSILINRLDQIVYTATQFSGVGSVIIKINGKTRQTLGADGLSISGPLHRRQ
jgi:spore germination protein GerM